MWGGSRLWCLPQQQSSPTPTPPSAAHRSCRNHDIELLLPLGQITFPGQAPSFACLSNRKGIDRFILLLSRTNSQPSGCFIFPVRTISLGPLTNLRVPWVTDCILIISGGQNDVLTPPRTSPLPFQAISNPNRHLKAHNQYPRFCLLFIAVRRHS